MRTFSFSLFLLFLLSCEGSSTPDIKNLHNNQPEQQIVSSKKFDEQSWQYFLQHLPVKKGIVVDYNGNAVANQFKQDGIVQYDVGKEDLQQCADALMRIRAEYLFSQKRYEEIGFHFVNGQYYTWDNYCKGLKAVPEGNDVRFITIVPSPKTHESLRKYLDIVYTYASTISFAKELKKTNDFTVGTVVIFPGSPGHCFIIVDEGTDNAGGKVFKLVGRLFPCAIYLCTSRYCGTGYKPMVSFKERYYSHSKLRIQKLSVRNFE